MLLAISASLRLRVVDHCYGASGDVIRLILPGKLTSSNPHSTEEIDHEVEIYPASIQDSVSIGRRLRNTQA